MRASRRGKGDEKGAVEKSAAPAAVAYDTSPEGRLALAARLWGWSPHPGQREFLTLRLPDGSEPQTLVAACGRRWGKTEAVGCDVATRILTEPDLGQMGVAPTRDQAECLFDSVEEKLRDLTEGAEDADAAARVLEEFPHLASLEFRRTPYPMIRRRDTGRWCSGCGRRVGRGGTCAGADDAQVAPFSRDRG